MVVKLRVLALAHSAAAASRFSRFTHSRSLVAEEAGDSFPPNLGIALDVLELASALAVRATSERTASMWRSIARRISSVRLCPDSWAMTL
jgi:hypothetical protein